MGKDMVHFLLVFDHAQERLLDKQQFHDTEAASAAYSAMESKHRGSDNLEIVLVGADSIETIYKTHGHYFMDQPVQSEYLAGV
jgi:hypothetical protein